MLNMSTLSTNDQGKSFENWSMAVSTKSWLIINYMTQSISGYFAKTSSLQSCRLLFSAVISESFSKTHMIISAMDAKR